MNKPHKHAALIKAWADGAKIEFFDKSNCRWTDIDTPAWNVNVEYHIKPEREYPGTNLSDQELLNVYDYGRFSLSNSATRLRIVANAAIKRYIQDQEKGNE